jgi:Type I site-specific restriction-modification system, R (restriction) subunit and related helicases
MTPEALARESIDRKLAQAGWVVQDMKALNLGAATGVAVREHPTDTGPADYVLFVHRQPVGVIEAKKDSAGENLTATEAQTERYASANLKWRKDSTPLRFLFEATGQIIRFTDGADPAPRSREIFHFFKPETLAAWLAQPDTLRRRLAEQMPALPEQNLRHCQISAVTGLEKSLALNKPRALVHMATGAGKTFTAITSVYRLLKFGGAKRILFLVDTRNLGKQAHQEFMAYTPPDDGRKFTELYNVQRLASPSIDPHAQVCISTIQRMYSILSGEPIDESAEDLSLNEVQQTASQAKLVRYNPAVPVETFDFIVIDECHRSIYNLWKQVLDYFDASLIGLTATPDKRTFGFFNENIVAEYTYEQSVADGVNVGYDVYTIETEVTQKGAELKAKEWVDHRDRQTRKKALERNRRRHRLHRQRAGPLRGQREPDPAGHPGHENRRGNADLPNPQRNAQNPHLCQDRQPRRRHHPHPARGVWPRQRLLQKGHLPRRRRRRQHPQQLSQRLPPAHRRHRRHDRHRHRRQAAGSAALHARRAQQGLLRANERPGRAQPRRRQLEARQQQCRRRQNPLCADRRRGRGKVAQNRKPPAGEKSPAFRSKTCCKALPWAAATTTPCCRWPTAWCAWPSNWATKRRRALKKPAAASPWPSWARA